MVLIDVHGTRAAVRAQETLTTGTVGAKVRFRFDEAWDGLSKVAVFTQGAVVKDAVVANGEAVIPWEALQIPGLPLSVGVYGSDGDDKALPTVWANTDPVERGADPSGDESYPPTPDVAQQILGATADRTLSNLTDKAAARGNLAVPGLADLSRGSREGADFNADEYRVGGVTYHKITAASRNAPFAAGKYCYLEAIPFTAYNTPGSVLQRATEISGEVKTRVYTSGAFREWTDGKAETHTKIFERELLAADLPEGEIFVFTPAENPNALEAELYQLVYQLNKNTYDVGTLYFRKDGRAYQALGFSMGSVGYRSIRWDGNKLKVSGGYDLNGQNDGVCIPVAVYAVNTRG